MLTDLTPYQHQQYVDVFYELFPSIRQQDEPDINKRGLGVYRVRAYERKVVIISDIAVGCSLNNYIYLALEKIQRELDLPVSCKFIHHQIPGWQLQFYCSWNIEKIKFEPNDEFFDFYLKEKFTLISGSEDDKNLPFLRKDQIENWVKVSIDWNTFVQSQAIQLPQNSHRIIKKFNVVKNDKSRNLDKIFYNEFKDYVNNNFYQIKIDYGEKLQTFNIDKSKIEDFLKYFDHIDCHNSLTRIVSTPPELILAERVLSCPWDKERLAESLAYLKQGNTTPPPIIVDVYILGENNYWYTVTDGMHRTTAAKMNAIKEIPAQIMCESFMPLYKFVLFDGHLFYLCEKSLKCLSRGKPEKYFYDLEKIGMKRFPDNIIGVILFFGYYAWLKLQQRVRPYKIWL